MGVTKAADAGELISGSVVPLGKSPLQLCSGMLFPCVAIGSGEPHFFGTEPRLQPTAFVGAVLNAVDCLLTHDPEECFSSLVQGSTDAHDVYWVALRRFRNIFVGEANVTYFVGKLRIEQIG